MLVFSIVVLAAGAADAGKKSGLPQLDPSHFVPQLVWLAITFGLLYFILSRFALPTVGQVIEERQARIKRDLDEAERMKGETEKALAAYEQALAEARGKAGGIARETRANLAAETDRERASVDAEINARILDAEGQIRSTKDRALGEVGTIAAETAAAIVERLSGLKPSADDIKRAMAG
jgi:F-type H+-transporting ATPase subunit b